MPALGPCNVTRDIRRCPMWQGRLTKASLTWGIVCASLRCPHVLWESWRPLEWFWWYWGQSVRWCAPLQNPTFLHPTFVWIATAITGSATPMLWAHHTTHGWRSCWVLGQSEQAEKARGHQNEGMSWRGGWSAHVAAPLLQQSVTPLHWTSSSKSSLSAYLHMLPCLRHINAWPCDLWCQTGAMSSPSI